GAAPGRDRFTLVLAAEDWPSLDERAGPLPLSERIAAEGQRWLVDRHDRLWIGSGETPGITVLDLQTRRLARYRPGDPESAPGRPVIAFFEDHAGGVWVRSLSGLRRVSPPSPVFRHLALPAPGHATRLGLDRQGRILAAVFCGPTYRLRADLAFERHPAI